MSEKTKRTWPSHLFWWAAGGIVAGTVVLLALAYFGDDGFRVGGVCQMGLLGIAAIVAAWYADETRRMADQTQRMADETWEAARRALQPNVDLRLVGSEESGDFVAEKVYLHNYGPGIARNVTVQRQRRDGAPNAGDRYPEPTAARLRPHMRSSVVDVSGYLLVIVRYRSMLDDACWVDEWGRIAKHEQFQLLMAAQTDS